jgi:hypothetical protein
MRDMFNVLFQRDWFGPFSVPPGPPPGTPPGDMLNVQIEKNWFGPHPIPNVYSGAPGPEPHVEQIYDWGPIDGLKTTSIWAQRMAQIPLVNYFSQQPPGQLPFLGRARLGQPPVFCRPGNVPVPTGVPGQSKCVPFSTPSIMIGPQPQWTVNTTVPPAYPTDKTFPIGPSWMNQP